MFTSELVLILVHVPRDFELLEAVHHFECHIFFRAGLFLDTVSLELALILIQDHISHMHLGNMIEAFFFFFLIC